MMILGAGISSAGISSAENVMFRVWLWVRRGAEAWYRHVVGCGEAFYSLAVGLSTD